MQISPTARGAGPYSGRESAIPFTVEPTDVRGTPWRLLLEGRTQVATRTRGGQSQSEPRATVAATLSTLFVPGDGSAPRPAWSEVPSGPRFLVHILTSGAIDERRTSVMIDGDSVAGRRYDPNIDNQLGTWEWRLSIPESQVSGTRYGIVMLGYGIPMSFVDSLRTVDLRLYEQGRAEWIDELRELGSG